MQLQKVQPRAQARREKESRRYASGPNLILSLVIYLIAKNYATCPEGKNLFYSGRLVVLV